MRGYYPGERRHRERPAPGLPGREPVVRSRSRERSRVGEARARRGSDWVIGIALGIVLGIAIVATFLYFGSEETIDAPSIRGVDSPQPTRQAPPATPGRE